MVKKKRAIGLVSLGLVVAIVLAGCGQPSGSGATGEPSGSTIVTAPAGAQPPANSAPPAEGAGEGVM